MKMKAFLMFVLLFLCSMGTKAQDLGANYNENIDYPITEIEMLKQSKVTWVRGFVNIPNLFLQNENGKIVGVKENEELVRLGKQLKRIPKYASMSQITEKVLEDEKELLKEELKKQGKPEKIWDKILPGQIERFIKDNTLIDQQYALFSQQYVLDDNKTVLEAVNDKAKELGGNIEIVEYTRFEVGEGLEKKEENFAEEVAAQMKQ